MRDLILIFTTSLITGIIWTVITPNSLKYEDSPGMDLPQDIGEELLEINGEIPDTIDIEFLKELDQDSLGTNQ